MSNTECLQCGAALADVWLCTTHAGDLRVTLQRLPALYSELQTTTARLDVMGRSAGPSGKGGPAPAILNFEASDLSALFRDRIRYWAGFWAKELNTGMLGTTIPYLAVFLCSLIPQIVTRQGAGAMLEEMAYLVRQGLKTVDKPANREGYAYAGACGAEFHNGTCQNQLWVRRGSHNMTCDRCGTIWDTDARRDSAFQAAENLLATATVISRALSAQELHITAHMIYQWNLRGKLEEAGRNKADQPLYRVGDVMGILAATSKKRKMK